MARQKVNGQVAKGEESGFSYVVLEGVEVGRPGLVLIEGRCYALAYLMDQSGDTVLGYRLAKPDLTVYDMQVNRRGQLECDCPDAHWRRRECKHARCIRWMGLNGELIEARGWECEPETVQPDAGDEGEGGTLLP